MLMKIEVVEPWNYLLPNYYDGNIEARKLGIFCGS